MLARLITLSFRTAGKRLAFVDSKALDDLAALLKRACALMEAAGQTGWLLRMATDERSHDEFVAVHNGILDILQVCGSFATSAVISCAVVGLPDC